MLNKKRNSSSDSIKEIQYFRNNNAIESPVCWTLTKRVKLEPS